MKTAVVTGASGGIGLETARALLADGWQVVCLSRHACPLEGVRSIPCDITDSAQVQAAFAAVDRVDLLVNNAGFGISGAVECTGEAEIRRQFDLNFFAWVTVIQAALRPCERVGGVFSIFPPPQRCFPFRSKAFTLPPRRRWKA